MCRCGHARARHDLVELRSPEELAGRESMTFVARLLGLYRFCGGGGAFEEPCSCTDYAEQGS